MRRQRRNKEESSLELTALIDVVFILLIFFMLTATFKKAETSMDLSLPPLDSEKLETTGVESLNLTITLEEMYQNGKEITFDELKDYLQSQKVIQSVELRVEDYVSYMKVMEVLSLLQKYKPKKISLLGKKLPID